MKSLCTGDSFPLCLYHADPEGSVYRNFFPLFLSQSTQHFDDCRPKEDFMKSIHVLIPDLYSQPSISEYRIQSQYSLARRRPYEAIVQKRSVLHGDLGRQVQRLPVCHARFAQRGSPIRGIRGRTVLSYTSDFYSYSAELYRRSYLSIRDDPFEKGKSMHR